MLTPHEIRERFGAIGVVADRAEAIQGGFRRPMTSRRDAAEAASKEFVQKLAQEAVGDPRSILVLPLLPIIGVVGVPRTTPSPRTTRRWEIRPTR